MCPRCNVPEVVSWISSIQMPEFTFLHLRLLSMTQQYTKPQSTQVISQGGALFAVEREQSHQTLYSLAREAAILVFTSFSYWLYWLGLAEGKKCMPCVIEICISLFALLQNNMQCMNPCSLVLECWCERKIIQLSKFMFTKLTQVRDGTTLLLLNPHCNFIAKNMDSPLMKMLLGCET